MNPSDGFAHILSTTQVILQRFTADLTPEEMLHRPANGQANCCAWTIGHLVLTDRWALTTGYGVTDLPPLPDGFEKRFSREAGCPQAHEFGDVSVLMPLFNQHRERLIDAVRSATPEHLARPFPKPHPMYANAGQMANFVAMHTSMHAGQISTIRRSLGRPPMM